MVKATLREQLRDTSPRDFALRPAWIRLIQVLRANKRASGHKAHLASRAAVERALDTPIGEDPEEVGELKSQLRVLVRELSERDPQDEELRSVALAIDEQVHQLLPAMASEPVSVHVLGWPDDFSMAQRERFLRRSLDSLLSLPPVEAAALSREFDGLVLGGCRLEVFVALSDGEKLPPVPRELRAQPMLRGRRSAWLPHLDEEGRRSLTERSRAQEHAGLINADEVIDACCGCGGNAIAFAMEGKQVLAIEKDATRIELARRNAAEFGVAEKIRFFCGELQEHLAPLMTEYPDAAVFVDPPWRKGDSIDEVPRWPDLLPGEESTARLLSAAPFVLLKLPRSFDIKTLPGSGWQLEWGFGDGVQSSAVLMITCWSSNPFLHR